LGAKSRAFFDPATAARRAGIQPRKPFAGATMTTRRQFLSGAAGALALASGASDLLAQSAKAAATQPSAAHLPRWRGFNLLQKFVAEYERPFRESDFELIQSWGFNFVRIPMSYRCWTDASDWLKLKEDKLKQIDVAVDFGLKHGIHTNLNLHRAPGYCVNPPPEPLSLWKDEAAVAAACFQWGHLAHRYKGRPNTQVSFDLLNEPADLPDDTYIRVVKRLCAAIWAEDPQRLIIADGLKWGTKPVTGLIGANVAQSTRGYQPMQISHFRANWIHGADKFAVPTWPLHLSDHDTWDKARLRKECIAPWKALNEKGVGVHVGEWGAFSHTPHDVVLAWMKDQLDLWRQAGWGWSLWNLDGGFGVLDSGRADVTYEKFKGHKLDRGMLEVLQAG
jgi:endoglucanase